MVRELLQGNADLREVVERLTTKNETLDNDLYFL
jgi:hypothetical protein